VDDIISFGQWLKLRRIALRLTRDELARRVGCAVITIRKIEADERRPSTQIAERLADQLNVPPEARTIFIKVARAELCADRLPPPSQTPHLAPVVVAPQPPPIPTSMLLPTRTTAPSDRNRKRMIEKVRIFWIAGVLENSLHGAARIDLGMEYRPTAVAHSWDLIVRTQPYLARMLLPDATIANMFDELGGELLILGTPGSGKTTILLELARELIARAERDADHPMPVVFNLSSWAMRCPALVAWLVDELHIRYGVPKKLGKSWVDADQVLPLLDGLDEVQAEHRAACVDAINEFRQDHGLVSLVVCSRSADYEALTARVKLHGAVIIQPLTLSQISAYLATIGDQLAALRAALAEDSALQELAQSPLMLTVMTLVYRGMAVDTPPMHSTLNERRAHLFAAYVDRVLQGRRADTRYTREQTIRWLSWLACRLAEKAQTMFVVEQLQTDWLTTRAERWHYQMVNRLGGVLLFGLLFGLGGVLPFGLLFELHVALLYGLVSGFIGGLIGGIGRWSNVGLHIVLLLTLLGAFAGLERGLDGALVGGLAASLAGGLSYALAASGSAAVSHLALRFALWRSGALPWNYACFFDYAAERILLRRVGSGYIFVHQLLMAYFAALSTPRSAEDVLVSSVDILR
jgi:transcriptional regulator with XRE-family HTH domain